MNYTYQLVEKFDGTQQLQRIEDSAWIPIDGGNGDYRAYLSWVEKGNAPALIPFVVEKVPKSDIERAVGLLLVLANPLDAENIALKNELLEKFESK